VSSYIEQLEQHGPKDASVEGTFSLALRRLEERSPAAFRLLQLCSVLSSEIDLELLYSDEMAEALAPLDPAVAERVVRGSLIQQINRLALLRLDASRSQIQVHRVLQHTVRSHMSQEQLEEMRHQVHKVLAASRPHGDVDDPETWRRFRMLWPHLEISDAVSCTEDAVRQLLIDRVRYLGQRGDLPQGRWLAERIDTTWMGLLHTAAAGPERDAIRRQLLHLRFNLANILRDEAQFARSRELDEAVLAKQRELLGVTHPHSLMTAGGLAADLRALGRYPEALQLDRETHAAWSENYGDDHPRTLTALNNLASSYRHMGDFRAALERDQVALQRRQVVLGETHPHTLASASNLGRDIREAGEYPRSVAQLASVADVLLERWGPDFRITLNAQANLATSLRCAGRAPEAAVLLDNAYERLNETLGPKGPDTLACRLSRAVNLLALNQIDLANFELEAVRQAYEQSLGPSHPHTLLCLSNLAAVARAAVPPETGLARQLAQVASDELAAALGPAHPYTLAARVNLAVCTAEDGDLAAALQPIDQTATQLGIVLGADHPDTLRCEGNLAILSGRLGLAGSDTMMNRALQRLVARLGTSHPAAEAMREGKFLHRIVEPHPF
jgi:tetratricopeptide (TPR) repeat protein